MDPFGHYANLVFANELENAIHRRNQNLLYKQLRDRSDPFNIPDISFVKLYRLPKHLVVNLIEELQQYTEESQRSTAVPFFLQVLLSLNFFATGKYQNDTGRDIHLAVSQPTASRIINKIANIFTIHLLPIYVKFPIGENELNRIKEGFENKLNFPNTIGAIDCTHVAIISPNINDPVHPGIAYLNRKGYYSVNVQVICDANMVLLNVNSRFPGATHDAAIWESSTINNYLRRLYYGGQRNTYLIGDSGYPIQPWMVTPIPNADPDTPEGRFTTRHCRARNVIERCIGLLKQRFRCLLKHRVLHYNHGTAGRIIYACAVLHNICRVNNIPLEIDEQELVDDDNVPNDVLDNANQENIDVLEEGRFVRQRIIEMLN